MSEPRIPHYLSRLDGPQRAASATERNCVVTAGAGAGKTTVLASRYLHLVMGGKIPVRSILALTFTKKAAAEMYERIYAALAAWTAPEAQREVLPDEQSWAREQLGDFQNAHITTLDSFCAEIARQAARDYGYSPEFSVDADASDDLAKNIAYRYVLRNRDKEGLDALLRSFPFDDVAARFFGDIGSRLVTPRALSETLFAPMKASMAALADRKEREVSDRLAAMAREVLNISAGATAPKADCAAAIESAAALINAPEPGEGRRAAIQAIGALKARAYSKGEAEQAIKAIVQGSKDEDVQGMRDLAKDIEAFTDYKDASPAHRALYDRLDEYSSELAEAKRRADVMDFKDLGACAVHALKRRKDIRDSWKAKIRAIMIDEFQDNNELQKDLLYLLAERDGEAAEGIPAPGSLSGDKLFFVGDEKQSIYRFRGADVSVFKRLSAELRETKAPEAAVAGGAEPVPEGITLSTNYRSAARLIAFFNDFFSAVMTAPPGGERDFAARYTAMDPGPDEASRANSPFPSQIRYYLDETSGCADMDESTCDGESAEEETDTGSSDDAPGSTPLDGDDNLAFEVARLIRRECGSLELRAKDANGAPTTRKASYGDFAVLLRTTTNQYRLEKYFRLLGVPFESESPRSLFRESPANDLYFILSLAQDPDDKAAYAAVLRGPLCRISENAFLRLMTSGKTIFGLADASARDTAALARAKAFFTALDRVIESSSVAEVVDYVWRQGGLRLALLARPEAHAFLEHYEYLFHLAAIVDRERGGVSAFLARVRPFVDGEEDTFELENVPRHSGRGVKVMTIHKAKGLQFPIVVIPWVENTGTMRRSQTLWERFPEGLAIDIRAWDRPGAKADNILYRLAKDLEEEKEIAEIKRLLYVACTRAEDHIFFFGKRRKTPDSRGRSFQYYLEAHDAIYPERVALGRNTLEDVRRWYKAREKPPMEAFAAAYEKARILCRGGPRRRLSVTDIALADHDVMGSFRDHEAPLENLENGAATESSAMTADSFGTLCHDAVENAIAASQGGSPVEGFVPRAELLRGLSASAAQASVARAIDMASAFTHSEFWTSLPPDAERGTEIAFLLTFKGFIVEGRIDVLIETNDEIIVVDFKSDAERDATRHRAQLALYRRAATGIAPGKRVNVGLYWLRTGELEWLENDLSDEELEDLAKRAAKALDRALA